MWTRPSGHGAVFVYILRGDKCGIRRIHLQNKAKLQPWWRDEDAPFNFNPFWPYGRSLGLIYPSPDMSVSWHFCCRQTTTWQVNSLSAETGTSSAKRKPCVYFFFRMCQRQTVTKGIMFLGWYVQSLAEWYLSFALWEFLQVLAQICSWTRGRTGSNLMVKCHRVLSQDVLATTVHTLIMT